MGGGWQMAVCEEKTPAENFTRTEDLFEDLTQLLGCTYISDISRPGYCKAACFALVSPFLQGYPAVQWRDMLQYLRIAPDVAIDSEKDAKCFLQDYVRELSVKSL